MAEGVQAAFGIKCGLRGRGEYHAGGADCGGDGARLEDAHPDGTRTVFFELNGQPREVTIRDKALDVKQEAKPKADPKEPGQIGAPIPGVASTIHVQLGQQVSKGDRLLVFTDGLTEAANANDQEFGEERIADFAAGCDARSAEEMGGLLLKRVDDYCRSQFQDDATLLVIAAT